MEQDNTVDIKMNLVNVLIFKGDKQVLNQKRYLDNIFLLDVQKRSVKSLEGRLGHYLKGTKN